MVAVRRTFPTLTIFIVILKVETPAIDVGMTVIGNVQPSHVTDVDSGFETVLTYGEFGIT